MVTFTCVLQAGADASGNSEEVENEEGGDEGKEERGGKVEEGGGGERDGEGLPTGTEGGTGSFPFASLYRTTEYEETSWQFRLLFPLACLVLGY